MLKVDQLSFGYNNSRQLHNISFTLKEGENLAVIGESGSGKSTLLKLLYGTYDLHHGEVFWKDTQVLGPAFNLVIGYDFMKYVSQEFDLMPFTTVAENIGQFLSNFYPEEKKERIEELLKVVELSEFSSTKVKFLSGGQKQRVALARAMAKRPEILLLDEPFSNIDNFKKQSLRRSLFHYLKENNIACIVATHDKDDVLGFADSMMVLSKGECLAKDHPEQLYRRPQNELTAAFFGEHNRFTTKELDLKDSPNHDIFIYANQLEVKENTPLQATVIDSYFKGSHYTIEASFNNKTIWINHKENLEKGKTFCFRIKAGVL
ncbi:ABC transporter ATP-binding protein [Mangrovimonas aestuarii]|uniref:ABC transporter ATP-binding protein n=1 Tax=Mangrovimonas aestuarii TaxID=3018443 RepID=UPI002379D1B2|nr:ABC transporter ATP-binding protein [Mangrovimonas aestuarii]